MHEGTLADEPTRALFEGILRPAELLATLGWGGSQDEIALPIPADPHGLIDRSAARSLIVTSEGDALALRRTLCSIIDRAAEPVAVSVLRPAGRSPEIEELQARLARAAPSIEFPEPHALRPEPGAQRLEAGESLQWGWPGPGPTPDGVNVAYIVPGISPAGGGGVLSVVQEARGLRRLGVQARVCLPSEAIGRAHSLYGESEELFVAYEREATVGSALGDATVVVATEHTSVPILARLARRRPELAYAYYVQDYEPLFAQLGSRRSDRALLSYGAVPEARLFAKTDFIRNLVMALNGVPVVKVEPSLDVSLFRAGLTRRSGPPAVAAMVRPSTPRRRPLATLATLAMIESALDGEVELMTFGCDQDELEPFEDRPTRLRHQGLLAPPEVAALLQRADVFIDASAYQGFGRAGLEAMACGAVPVLPGLGGVREYALDDRNAILLKDDSPESIAEVVSGLLRDRARLERLRRAGLETAGRFSVDRAARSQLELFACLGALPREPHRGHSLDGRDQAV